MPILLAQALLIMGVSSLHSSTNFLRSFSFWGPEREYAGKKSVQEDTRPVNHSPVANLMTMGAKAFWISESVSTFAIFVRDLVAYIK